MPLRAFDAGRLFGRTYGDGAPEILALHGWARTGSDFDRVLSGSNAISLDLPGFGASPEPAYAIGAHGYADHILGVLDEFERPPILVAHSFGGRVAVCLESEVPGSFSSMVLTGVPLLRRESAGKPSLGYRAMRFAHRAGLISDQRMEHERKRRGSPDYRAATGVMRDVLVTVVNESYEHELSELDLPVTLVWGGEDTEVPMWVADRAAQIVGDKATIEVIGGAGHLIPTTHPEALTAAIEALR